MEETTYFTETRYFWTCPHCGYKHEDLEDPADVDGELMCYGCHKPVKVVE